MSALRAALLLITVGTIAVGCGGSRSSSVVPTPQRGNDQAARHARSFTAPGVPASTTIISGQVYGVTSSVINIQTGVCGYIDAYTNSNTHYDTAAPTAGQYVVVTGVYTGSGSCPSAINPAAYVSTYASPVPSTGPTSGFVSAVGSDGYTFSLTSGSTTSTVVLNSYDDGAAPPAAVGDDVTVSGKGSTERDIHATSVTIATPAPLPSGQDHIRTFALALPSGTHGYTGSATAAAPYLSWANTNASGSLSYQASLRTAGIKLVYYVDLNRVESTALGDPSTDIFAGYLQEGDYAHSVCPGTSADRIVFTYSNGAKAWVTDPHSATLAADYAAFVRHTNSGMSGGPWDAVLEDDAGSPTYEGGYGWTNFSAPACSYTSDSDWINAEKTVEQTLDLPTTAASPGPGAGSPTIFNGLSAGTTSSIWSSPNFALFASNPAAIGASYDDCYDSEQKTQGQPNLGYSTNWVIPEDAELKMAATSNGSVTPLIFICRVADTNLGTAVIPARIYVIASFLLTYDTTNVPSSSSLWEYYDYDTNLLTVFPESRLIVQDPYVAAPADVSGLKDPSTGAYIRQYYRCFLAGTFAGPCGVAVNSNGSASVTNPIASQYGHTLSLQGDTVLNGGTASATGPAPSATLAAGSAVVMFP
jgi:hypothetical protein